MKDGGSQSGSEYWGTNDSCKLLIPGSTTSTKNTQNDGCSYSPVQSQKRGRGRQKLPRNRISQVGDVIVVHLKNSEAVALIDAEDYPKIADHIWYLRRDGAACRYARPEGPFPPMHRMILAGSCIDHINGDGLDNRKANLRSCSRAENLHNTRKTARPCSSRFKGVRFHRRHGKYLAEIQAHGKRRYLGCFESEEDAARAYDSAARRLHGQFARLNLPNG